jgi:hypothetical protein
MIQQEGCMSFIWKRILSSGGLLSAESIPGRAAATRRNNWKLYQNILNSGVILYNTRSVLAQKQSEHAYSHVKNSLPAVS